MPSKVLCPIMTEFTHQEFVEFLQRESNSRLQFLSDEDFFTSLSVSYSLCHDSIELWHNSISKPIN